MLKHFNIVVTFLVVLFVLLYADQTADVSALWYVLLFVVFLSLEFYGAAYIRSGFHIPAFCNSDTTEKTVALSFDDGPSLKTLKILEVLKEFDVKASFFCIGKEIKGKEEILKKTFEAGHVIGNHSFSHGAFFDLKNTGSMILDLELAQEEIKKVIGKSPLLFRPPYGVTTPALARAVKKLNFQVIGWNIRSLDTKLKDPSQIMKRVKEQLVPGSVILFHDTMDGTEIVMKELLIYLKENNYRICPLDELTKKKVYA